MVYVDPCIIPALSRNDFTLNPEDQVKLLLRSYILVYFIMSEFVYCANRIATDALGETTYIKTTL